MSKEKIISPEVKALINQVEELKKQIEKLSALRELLETEKDLRKLDEEKLEKALGLINKVKKWAEEFERFSDSEYKGSFIYEEIKKVMKEKK